MVRISPNLNVLLNSSALSVQVGERPQGRAVSSASALTVPFDSIGTAINKFFSNGSAKSFLQSWGAGSFNTLGGTSHPAADQALLTSQLPDAPQLSARLSRSAQSIDSARSGESARPITIGNGSFKVPTSRSDDVEVARKLVKSFSSS